MTTSFDPIDALRALGLRSDRAALEALIVHAGKSNLGLTQFIERLCTLERREREAKNLAQRTKTATLGAFKTLDHFDWNHPRTVDRALYEMLTDSLDWMTRGENILLRGPAGVGKTTLAKNLALRALERGHTVRVCSLPAVMADLLAQESIPATERRLLRYTSPSLLVLDELGYLPCDQRAADLFFRIVSRRHEQKPIVVTTNLPYKQWAAVFQDASCLAPLIDRFAQHCHTLDIDADSWRRKDAKARKEASADKPKKLPAKTLTSTTE